MSSSSEVSGSCTAVTFNPFLSRSKITLLHHDASAYAPCTKHDVDLGSHFSLFKKISRSRCERGRDLNLCARLVPSAWLAKGVWHLQPESAYERLWSQ